MKKRKLPKLRSVPAKRLEDPRYRQKIVPNKRDEAKKNPPENGEDWED